LTFNKNQSKYFYGFQLSISIIKFVIGPAKKIISNHIIAKTIIVFDFLAFSSSQAEVNILNQAYIISNTANNFKNVNI
jgi:hypothetical protein